MTSRVVGTKPWSAHGPMQARRHGLPLSVLHAHTHTCVHMHVYCSHAYTCVYLCICTQDYALAQAVHAYSTWLGQPPHPQPRGSCARSGSGPAGRRHCPHQGQPFRPAAAADSLEPCSPARHGPASLPYVLPGEALRCSLWVWGGEQCKVAWSED